MSLNNYFGGWSKIIDAEELSKINTWLSSVDRTLLCPSINKVFRAFQLCPYDKCKIVILSQDPYPQKDIAQGLAFANSETTTSLSPSLEIIKESVINFEIPHYSYTFDITLGSWAEQGILLLNSALTCELNKPGSHTQIWTPFMSKLVSNLSKEKPMLIWVLMGNQAKMYERYIKGSYIFKCNHPSFYARTGIKLPHKLWLDINEKCYDVFKEKIIWYEEFKELF